MSRQPIRFRDIARLSDEPLAPLSADDLMPLPALSDVPELTPPRARWLENYDLSLDGFSDFDIPMPKTPEEQERLAFGAAAERRRSVLLSDLRSLASLLTMLMPRRQK